MHAAMESLPAQVTGNYERREVEAGEMTLLFERIPAGFPPGGEAIYRGLEEEACQCPHWGFVFSGRLEFRYTDGTKEAFGPGEAYYAKPGHRWRCLEEAETLEYSPTDAMHANSGRIEQNIEEMGEAGVL